jgi:hypothetical protein
MLVSRLDIVAKVKNAELKTFSPFAREEKLADL